MGLRGRRAASGVPPYPVWVAASAGHPEWIARAARGRKAEASSGTAQRAPARRAARVSEAAGKGGVSPPRGGRPSLRRPSRTAGFFNLDEMGEHTVGRQELSARWFGSQSTLHRPARLAWGVLQDRPKRCNPLGGGTDATMLGAASVSGGNAGGERVVLQTPRRGDPGLRPEGGQGARVGGGRAGLGLV